jgi:hypothetical protein
MFILLEWIKATTGVVKTPWDHFMSKAAFWTKTVWRVINALSSPVSEYRDRFAELYEEPPAISFAPSTFFILVGMVNLLVKEWLNFT